jgi:hypothetical protein
LGWLALVRCSLDLTTVNSKKGGEARRDILTIPTSHHIPRAHQPPALCVIRTPPSPKPGHAAAPNALHHPQCYPITGQRRWCPTPEQPVPPDRRSETILQETHSPPPPKSSQGIEAHITALVIRPPYIANPHFPTTTFSRITSPLAPSRVGPWAGPAGAAVSGPTPQPKHRGQGCREG